MPKPKFIAPSPRKFVVELPIRIISQSGITEGDEYLSFEVEDAIDQIEVCKLISDTLEGLVKKHQRDIWHERNKDAYR